MSLARHPIASCAGRRRLVAPVTLRPLLRALLLATATLAAGCHDDALGSDARGAGPNGSIVGGEDDAPPFTEATFDELYPIFLQHKVGSGPKAALWAQRYHRRWVRWSGQIRSYTTNGLTIRQLGLTSTFDVSLWINNSERTATRAKYKVGDFVTYVGRLDSYDDIWRTLYLVNGSIVGLDKAVEPPPLKPAKP